MKFSIVTNVSNADLPRIKNIIPRWLDTFGDYFDELLIIYDNNELSGRLKDLQQGSDYSDQIEGALKALQNTDARVKVINLNYKQLEDISAKWFTSGSPRRCHTGSPVYPYVFALTHAKNDIILKCDSDILFYNAGFIDVALTKIQEFDIVTPPRNIMQSHVMSSRAYFINRASFYHKILPLKLRRLSWFKTLVYLVKGHNLFNEKKASIFFSFEDAINLAISRKLIAHYHISKEFGNSLHIRTNKEAEDPFYQKVINAFERGRWPQSQEEYAMDYHKPLWEAFLN